MFIMNFACAPGLVNGKHIEKGKSTVPWDLLHLHACMTPERCASSPSAVADVLWLLLLLPLLLLRLLLLLLLLLPRAFVFPDKVARQILQAIEATCVHVSPHAAICRLKCAYA